ncbi:hypothetical protein C7M84_020280 [Penaeus vannamei]|uniref:Uncharacterized protein n=1 Tax=Penaeus vannamei TaxID=6689 RepID=A0A423SCE5_PENVA|nr:hypothetical protein C7M84_020280 [Penaeus vannamei]
MNQPPGPPRSEARDLRVTRKPLQKPQGRRTEVFEPEEALWVEEGIGWRKGSQVLWVEEGSQGAARKGSQRKGSQGQEVCCGSRKGSQGAVQGAVGRGRESGCCWFEGSQGLSQVRGSRKGSQGACGRGRESGCCGSRKGSQGAVGRGRGVRVLLVEEGESGAVGRGREGCCGSRRGVRVSQRKGSQGAVGRGRESGCCGRGRGVRVAVVEEGSQGAVGRGRGVRVLLGSRKGSQGAVGQEGESAVGRGRESGCCGRGRESGCCGSRKGRVLWVEEGESGCCWSAVVMCEGTEANISPYSPWDPGSVNGTAEVSVSAMPKSLRHSDPRSVGRAPAEPGTLTVPLDEQRQLKLPRVSLTATLHGSAVLVCEAPARDRPGLGSVTRWSLTQAAMHVHTAARTLMPINSPLRTHVQAATQSLVMPVRKEQAPPRPLLPTEGSSSSSAPPLANRRPHPSGRPPSRPQQDAPLPVTVVFAPPHPPAALKQVIEARHLKVLTLGRVPQEANKRVTCHASG